MLEPVTCPSHTLTHLILIRIRLTIYTGCTEPVAFRDTLAGLDMRVRVRVRTLF